MEITRKRAKELGLIVNLADCECCYSYYLDKNREPYCEHNYRYLGNESDDISCPFVDNERIKKRNDR